MKNALIYKSSLDDELLFTGVLTEDALTCLETRLGKVNYFDNKDVLEVRDPGKHVFTKSLSVRLCVRILCVSISTSYQLKMYTFMHRIEINLISMFFSKGFISILKRKVSL